MILVICKCANDLFANLEAMKRRVTLDLFHRVMQYKHIAGLRKILENKHREIF